LINNNNSILIDYSQKDEKLDRTMPSTSELRSSTKVKVTAGFLSHPNRHQDLATSASVLSFPNRIGHRSS